MTITNLSQHKVKESEENGTYVLDYGTIKKLSDSTIQIVLEDTQPLSNFRSRQCGCTTVKSVQEENKIKLTIAYDTKLVGQFSKTIQATYNAGLTKKIQIRGTVK